MIGKYDFVLVYESLSREIESIALLFYLLTKKGYKVRILNERSLIWNFISTKVLVVPYLYSTEDVKFFNRSLFFNVDKIVNLQWEQVVSESDLITNFHNPKGDALYGYHICWGKKTYERLSAAGVSTNQICVTGNISMDFNNERFDAGHLDVHEIKRKYDLHNYEHVNLFISSFVFEDLSIEQLMSLKGKIQSIDKMKTISDQTKKTVLEWFVNYLRNNKSEVLIYRPHPSENISESILEIQNKFTNFRIIKDFSVRQWIKVSDKIITWYSTSLVDCYFAHKKCIVLRPYEIPEFYDISFFAEELKIIDESAFIQSMNNFTNLDKKVNRLIEEQYGSIDYSGFIHKKVMDYLITVHGNKYGFKYKSYNIWIKIKLFFLDIFAELSVLDFMLKVTPKKYYDFILKYNSNKKPLRKNLKFYNKQYKKIELESSIHG